MIILDVMGILLVLGMAMVVGRTVSEAVGTAVYNALLTSSPQWAEAAAIVSGSLAGLAVGVGVGWLVRVGRAEKSIFERQAKTSATID